MTRIARPDDPPSSEFALAVECCRSTFAGRDPSRAHRLTNRVDWNGLVRLSRRHRIEGLVWHGLRSLAVALPAETERALATDAKTVAQHNLRAARQSGRLLNGFGRAAIPLIFIKGLTLSKLAYGDPFIKMSQDIDVLVPPDAIAEAAAELRRLGFVLTLPEAHLERWHQTRKESVWRSPDGLYLELHSRLADNRELIPTLDAISPRQDVEIAPAIVLPTLAPDELFAYLCVHGASSAWFRLKWITDVAALLHGLSDEQIRSLYGRAQELGAGRAAAQALFLSHKIYGTRIEALGEQLNHDHLGRWLASAASAVMLRPAEPTAMRFGTAMIHLTQFFLKPGLTFKVNELRRQISDASVNSA